YPERFHDVAIAEQHAVTFAAGLATGGAKPVVAIYSTFLQRAYDQLIHDVAIQNMDVLFAVDRASLLEDGPTHSGVFDLSFCRTIPNLMIIAPANATSLRALLDFGYEHPGPCLVRYPRGALDAGDETIGKITGIKGNIIREGTRVAILSFGAVLPLAEPVAGSREYTLADMQFVKPLDTELVDQLAQQHDLLVTLEENAVAGGAGAGVAEYLSARGNNTPILHLGVPDRFILQDEPSQMLMAAGLSETGILDSIDRRLSQVQPEGTGKIV
ncbi:MAG: 1-deoxy-D-xylulose-5-phosphate synthase, partial [Proteobacteria bacterium]|nr:1-deoxy-D-xylulose-5-phosphate synthase [Pseudomonadota bacterium]